MKTIAQNELSKVVNELHKENKSVRILVSGTTEIIKDISILTDDEIQKGFKFEINKMLNTFIGKTPKKIIQLCEFIRFGLTNNPRQYEKYMQFYQTSIDYWITFCNHIIENLEQGNIQILKLVPANIQRIDNYICDKLGMNKNSIGLTKEPLDLSKLIGTHTAYLFLQVYENEFIDIKFNESKWLNLIEYLTKNNKIKLKKDLKIKESLLKYLLGYNTFSNKINNLTISDYSKNYSSLKDLIIEYIENSKLLKKS